MLVLGLAGHALAIERSDLDYRIRLLTAKFEAMQARPETAIPPDVLQNVRGVILMERTKAGLVFAFEGGGGVAMVKDDANATGWSPVAFMGASQLSLGFQAGAEEGFYAILLMDDSSTHLLTSPNYEYGSEARGTAGDASGGAGSAISPLRPHVLVYSDRSGLYGGADLTAGGIVPDDKANFIYYGRAWTMSDILFDNKVEPSEPALALAKDLKAHATPAQVSANVP